MSCDEFRDHLHERLRGKLPAEQRARMEAHAASCPECADFEARCRELTCKEFVDFLHAYLDHELSAERTTVFDRHLAVCPDCTSYLRSYRETMSLSVQALTDKAMKLPGKVPEDLVRAILDAREAGE